MLSDMDYLLLICSLFYIVAGSIACVQLITPDKSLASYFFPAVTFALASHGYWLYQHLFMVNGQNLSLLNLLSLLVFIISLLSTLAGKRFKTELLRPVIYTFTVLSLIVTSYLPGNFAAYIEAHPQIALHILLAMLAYSILAIAILFALQFTYLDYRLKKHKLPLTKMQMPPLMTLEKSLFQLILIGFLLLSGTLLSGFIFAEDMFAQDKMHKTVLAIIAWIIYATLLWGHFARGWRGRFAIYITIIGSSLLTLAVLASTLYGN